MDMNTTDFLRASVGPDEHARAELRSLIDGKAADSRAARVAHSAYWLGVKDGAEVSRLRDSDRL